MTTFPDILAYQERATEKDRMIYPGNLRAPWDDAARWELISRAAHLEFYSSFTAAPAPVPAPMAGASKPVPGGGKGRING